jgi:hypothetical protein
MNFKVALYCFIKNTFFILLIKIDDDYPTVRLKYFATQGIAHFMFIIKLHHKQMNIKKSNNFCIRIKIQVWV